MNRRVIRNSKGQIQIGPTVTRLSRKRAHHGRSYYAWILPRPLEHLVVHLVAVPFREHQ